MAVSIQIQVLPDSYSVFLWELKTKDKLLQTPAEKSGYFTAAEITQVKDLGFPGGLHEQ